MVTQSRRKGYIWDIDLYDLIININKGNETLTLYMVQWRRSDANHYYYNYVFTSVVI